MFHYLVYLNLFSGALTGFSTDSNSECVKPHFSQQWEELMVIFFFKTEKNPVSGIPWMELLLN